MASEDGLTVKAYAEVWGTDSSGYEYTPVAWIEAMVDPETLPNGHTVLTMQLDTNWLHLAQAQAPFQLRNVWIEDRDSNVPLSSRSRIFVDSSSDFTVRQFRPNPNLRNIPITDEMRNGPRPRGLNLTAVAGAPTLFLVHGYCASVNEFPTSQFTDAIQFQDFKQSRSNDAFALRIDSEAKKNGMTFYSIVGHSQGGLAAIHLHTFYWSGLEPSKPGRLIQSVGSPYAGCGLAGSLAGIGGVFGMGCGSNTDLTYDGASLWLKSIPPSKAQQVYYYTTTYGSKGYCAWGANMVLTTPNDGTTEIKYAALPGGNSAGSKSDWCHTTEMVYPAQCADATRNAEMNSNAAR